MTALSDLFTDEVVQRLAAVVRTNVSPWDDGGVPVRRRHEVVRCGGPSPWQSGWALRKAWELYLEAAKDCGLLDDVELVANLTGTDDESFRGALAECNAAWFLRQLGLTVTPKPEPKDGKNIDFAVARGELTFYVEVKAPYVPQLTNHGSATTPRFFAVGSRRRESSSRRAAATSCCWCPFFGRASIPSGSSSSRPCSARTLCGSPSRSTRA